MGCFMTSDSLMCIKCVGFFQPECPLGGDKIKINLTQNLRRTMKINCHVYHMLSYILAYEYVTPISQKYFLRQNLGDLLMSCI